MAGFRETGLPPAREGSDFKLACRPSIRSIQKPNFQHEDDDNMLKVTSESSRTTIGEVRRATRTQCPASMSPRRESDFRVSTNDHRGGPERDGTTFPARGRAHAEKAISESHQRPGRVQRETETPFQAWAEKSVRGQFGLSRRRYGTRFRPQIPQIRDPTRASMRETGKSLGKLGSIERVGSHPGHHGRG